MNDRCCDHAANGDPHVCGQGEPCPQGCGGLTFDPYGGPCQRCWDAAGRETYEAVCICGPDLSGEAPDYRPDCPAHEPTGALDEQEPF